MSTTTSFIDKKAEKKLMERVSSYAFKGASLRIIAAQCGVNWGLFQRFLAGDSKTPMTELTFRKITKWLDSHDEFMPNNYVRCNKCGQVKSISDFYKDRKSPNGHRRTCIACDSARKKQKNAEVKMSNNNTTTAITVEIVKKVKAEDNKEVAAAMLAPYFKITAKQLEEIREGKWDSLLYKKEPPKPAVDVKNAVESLRLEIAELHSAINRIMVELGCAEDKKEA